MILKPYGTILAVAILLGAYVSSLEAKRQGRGGELVWDGLVWVLGFGFLGARIYHILNFWEFYKLNKVLMVQVWNGGLGIYGAFLGGMVGLLVWGKGLKGLKGIKILEILDIAAPGMAVGQAVGRFANYFSQELYGWPTNLPWGIYIAREKRFYGLESFAYFHPLFLYESLWNLLNFALLIYISRKYEHKLLPGELFAIYLPTYAVGRLFLEGLRIESWMLGGYRMAQLVSIVLILASVVLVILRRARNRLLKLDL